MNVRNRRVSARKSFVFPATLYRVDLTKLCTCRLMDISETGARMRIDKEYLDLLADFPERFFMSLAASEDVLEKSMNVARPCEKVWQNDNEIGIRFAAKGRS